MCIMNWFHPTNATEIGIIYLIYFVEFLAVYIEKNCQLLFTMFNYISIMPAVFKLKRMKKRMHFFNYLHIATIIYCNSTEVNGSGSNELSEKNKEKEKDTEYTGASQEENEFELDRQAELDSLLDHIFHLLTPSSPPQKIKQKC